MHYKNSSLLVPSLTPLSITSFTCTQIKISQRLNSYTAHNPSSIATPILRHEFKMWSLILITTLTSKLNTTYLTIYKKDDDTLLFQFLPLICYCLFTITSYNTFLSGLSWITISHFSLSSLNSLSFIDFNCLTKIKVTSTKFISSQNVLLMKNY